MFCPSQKNIEEKRRNIRFGGKKEVIRFQTVLSIFPFPFFFPPFYQFFSPDHRISVLQYLPYAHFSVVLQCWLVITDIDFSTLNLLAALHPSGLSFPTFRRSSLGMTLLSSHITASCGTVCFSYPHSSRGINTFCLLSRFLTGLKS